MKREDFKTSKAGRALVKDFPELAGKIWVSIYGQYLRNDGTIRDGTGHNEQGPSGWFDSQEEAEAAIGLCLERNA